MVNSARNVKTLEEERPADVALREVEQELNGDLDSAVQDATRFFADLRDDDNNPIDLPKRTRRAINKVLFRLFKEFQHRIAQRVMSDITRKIAEGHRQHAETLSTMEDKVDEVCNIIADGSTTRQACAVVGMTTREFTRMRRDDFHDLQRKYDIACAERAEMWSDDIIDEALDASHDDFQGQRIRIETKKWLMGKTAPRFSDKKTHVVEGGVNPIRQVTVNMSLEEAQRTYAEAIKSLEKK